MSQATVLLHDLPVGTMRFHHGNSEFVFERSYQEMVRRPVLSLSFENLGLSRVYRQANGPQRFFANLLPPDDSELKNLLRKQHRFSNDFELLRLLGGDLPGAVKVVINDEQHLGETSASPPSRDAGPLRFSLGGLQLKFSGEYDAQQRMTVPARGMGGSWILKFPSMTYRDITRAEFLMLGWARACALNVPEARLVLAKDVLNIPVQIPDDTPVLVVRRFDRQMGGPPVHAEDFAQVFNIHPGNGDSIYTNKTYAGLARFAGTLEEREDRVEFCRRVVFMLMSGNGDAHLKNWGVYYPDRLHARLSPAYDLIFTRVYATSSNDGLALNLGGVHDAGRAWSAATRAVLLDVLSATGLPPEEVAQVVDATVQHAHDRLNEILQLPEAIELSAEWHSRLRAHVSETRLRLLP